MMPVAYRTAPQFNGGSRGRWLPPAVITSDCSQAQRAFGVDFGNPDIVKLAEAFSLLGFAVQRADEFAPALEKALALDRPSVIAVPVDYSENVRLTETLGDVQVTI